MSLSQQNNLRLQEALYLSASATVLASFSRYLDSSFYSTNDEIEALLRLERLQSGLEILKRKHSTDLLSVVQQQPMKRNRVKEEELERVKQRNWELEEQVMQLSSESQIWFNYAKSVESVVSDLRAKLNDVSANQNKCPMWILRRVESVCEADEVTELHRKATCRVCREREVCVLRLPCRHLCLCKGCEGRMETCPVCNSPGNANIQVVVP